MTLRQLEQYLLTEKWRAGAKNGTDMCGRYARCAYCDRFLPYPCASAYDKYVKNAVQGGAAAPAWAEPEPPVKEKFGAVRVDCETTERAPLREKETENERRQQAAPQAPVQIKRNVIKIEQTAGDVRVLSLKKRI